MRAVASFGACDDRFSTNNLQPMKASIFTPIVTVMAVCLLITTSCKKQVHKVNEDYVGYWEALENNSFYFFNIESNSDAEYEENTAGAFVNFTGKVRLRNDRLNIARLKGFKVDQHPAPVNDSSMVWSMVLDGVTYFTVK